MKIEGDKEVYILSKVLDEIYPDEGMCFLRDYWNRCGKLRYITKLFGNSFEIRADEIQYLVTAENALEKLSKSFSKFLPSNHCHKEHLKIGLSAEVKRQSEELVHWMRELKKWQTLKYGWESFCKNLLECSTQIEKNINELAALKLANFEVNFQSNVTADDILSTAIINFDNASGKYFLFNN